MPKGKKKGKFEHRRTEQAYSSDEDAGIDMTNDNLSETSGQSDMKSNQGDADNEIQEKLEEKVLEAIDALSARSAGARAAAFVALRGALQRRPLQSALANHKAALADCTAKALRRGKDAERRAAAAIAPVLALQIGEEGSEEFVQEVRPALAAAAADRTGSLDTRTECCSSLATLCFLLEEDLSEILEVMRLYETIFSGSYLKGDGTVKVSGAAIEEGQWHAAALDGWALLLPLLPASHAAAVLAAQPPSAAKLAELLEAGCLEVRLSAGNALATAHEHITSEQESPELSRLAAQLQSRLEELSRESHKYRAKRDRKLQRATFRDVLKYFESGDVSPLSVRIGSETASFAWWGGRAAYAALAATLGGALPALAPTCAPLRAALAMGEPMLVAAPTAKLNKLQRHLQNSAADKARTVARNKNRDKRSAALAM